MLNEVEKKCSLLTRFVTENLDGYAEQVRDNLSVYLNTAEKIRLRISRNAVTLTDRTIWHNKIERVPVSLVRECKVDHMSPKICYFANETITNKYQVVALLCKSSEDSHKLMSILQHKLNSQGHYRAHSQWLRNGNFVHEEPTTPKLKHKTIASVEIVESPKLATRFAWGVPRHTSSLPQVPATPSSIRSRRDDLDSTLDYGESEDDNDFHDYVPINDIRSPQLSPPVIKQTHQRFSSIESQKRRQIARQLEPLPDPPTINNEYQNYPLRYKLEQSECSHPVSPVLSRHNHTHDHDFYSRAYTDQTQNHSTFNTDQKHYYHPTTPVSEHSRQSFHHRDVLGNRNNIQEQSEYVQPVAVSSSPFKRTSSFSLRAIKNHVTTRRSFRIRRKKTTDFPEMEEVDVEMRKPRYERSSSISYVEQHGHKVPMSEVMRSSVIQYDSDADNTESIQPETAAVQHNSNGIARVVVGGNEVIDNETKSSGDKCADKELVTDHNPDSGEDSVIKHTSDNIISTSRQNGDGATSPDFAILKQTDRTNATHELGSPLSDNTLDGIYDNLGLTSPDRTPTAEQKIPLSVEELLKSCEMEEQSNDVIENNINKTETADSQNGEPRLTKEEKSPDVIEKTEADSDDDDDEYELVLTGLKQLTKGINTTDTQAETRYPHQIISAMATNDTNKSRPVPAKDKTAPFQTTSIPTVPTHITPIVLPTTSQSASKATPASTPTTAVKMRSRSTQPDNSVKSDNSKRPQSVSSGLHLIRTNNELRRSVRRKGQYKSIAEYEKLNNNSSEGVITLDSQVNIVNPQPTVNHRDSLHSISQIDVSHTTQAPPIGKRTPQPIRHVKHKPTLSPEMYRSITSLSGMPHHTTNTSQHQSDQVNMRSKEDRTRSSYRNLARETEAGSRRQSVISISSVPNHVVLRRVDSKHADILTKAEKKAEADRKSRSFDRKNNISLQEGVMPQGLTLVGSRTSLVSHGRSQTNILSNQSQKVHRNKERVGLQQMSLGEPNATPILDGKRKAHAAQRTRTTPISSKLQGSHIPGFKKQTSRSHYVSLPNQPDLAFYRHQHLTTPQFNWNGVSWDQNPGFKRFFDSILTYGPNGSKSASRDKVKHSNAHNNQPDIVLESLNHDKSRADDSDSENSSIRSSASAYWPPELKLQCNNGEEFEEETASWQFHNAIGQPHHPINAA